MYGDEWWSTRGYNMLRLYECTSIAPLVCDTCEFDIDIHQDMCVLGDGTKVCDVCQLQVCCDGGAYVCDVRMEND